MKTTIGEIKVGTVLMPNHTSDKNKFVTKVEGILEKMIFTRNFFDNGARGPYEGPIDIEDLITYGFTIQTKTE